MERICRVPELRKIVAFMLVLVFVGLNLRASVLWAVEMEPQIHFTTLASGHQVYVKEIRTQPIVTIDTWVNTGSAQEVEQNNGVSHFLEHLLFKGTGQYRVGEIDRILESRGANFNAATSKDFTHYYITTASPYFQEALALHADMLLNATIPPDELDRERKVVQEEINRALDNPSRKAYMAMARQLYGQHPYGLDALGPKVNIQNLPREAILDYYHRWYQPENFRTVVVGDMNAQDAVRMVDEAFSKAYVSQDRPEAAQPKLSPVPRIDRPQSEVLSDPNLSAVQVSIAFSAPPISQREDNYALDIAAMVLGQGASSRLYQNVKEKQHLVTDVGAGNGTMQQSGLFYVSADTTPEKREQAKRAVLEEISRFKLEGPTPQELEKARTQVIKQFAFLNESTSGVAQSVGYNVTIGTLEDYTEYVANMQKITAAQVQEAARKYLDFNRAVVVEVIPGEESASHEQDAAANIVLLQRIARNETAMARKAAGKQQQQSVRQNQADDVTKVVLDNGATLLMKPSPTTQTVAITMFAKGGRLVEPKPGVASLTGRVWMKGTANRTAEQLSEELERLGLSLSINSDEDYMRINGTSVSSDLPKLMFVMQDVLNNPVFPQDELEKERANMLQELKTSRDVPSNLLFEKLYLALYREHPYGAIGERVEASLPSLTRDDLVSFYQQSMQPSNLVISVVGNFDPQQVQTGFRQMLSEGPAMDPLLAQSGSLPDVQPLADDVQVDAQKPEQAATWIAYGWLAPGISRDRDYLTLKLINNLLGSGLSSRLFVELREKQGLAYHVSSQYPSAIKQSRFVMYIGTDPKNQEKVLQGFNTQINRLQTERISDEELELAKSKLIGQFALAHETNANQAYFLGVYETLGVGYQFDQQYPGLIQQVTAEDVQRVARDWFSQPKVVTIVAPKTIRGETSHHDQN